VHIRAILRPTIRSFEPGTAWNRRNLDEIRLEGGEQTRVASRTRRRCTFLAPDAY
jgi:hypothetical protein